MLKRLRLRFVVVNMSIATVMLLVIFGMVYHFTRQNLESQSLTMLRSVSVTPEIPMRPGEAHPQVTLPFFSLRESNGIWLVDRGGYFDLSDQEYLQNLAQTAVGQQRNSGVLKEYNLRFLRTDTPAGTMLAFADITSEQNTLHKLIETCVIIGLVSFAAFLGISLLLARWAVKPVEKAWQQQKQFVADASHELKTPLTVIQTGADLLRQADDPAERTRYLDNIQEMSHRMRNLVEELLLLARSDNQRSTAALTEIAFDRIVSDGLLPFEPVFFEAGLTLSSQIDSCIRVRGNAEALRRLLGILLDNARKYSLPGGETTVTLQGVGKRAMLCISNPSEPMTQQQCRDIFKRFYRTDASRTGGESFGLGLSIAESIAAQHRGKISAAYENGCFSVCVSLPMIV